MRTREIPLAKKVVLLLCLDNSNSTPPHFRINAVSTGQVTGEAYTDGCLGQKGRLHYYIDRSG